MNYRSMVLNLRLHPKTVRGLLNYLIKKGLVKEEGRTDWKRGKKLWYSLTEKGRSKLVNEALERVNEGLKIVEEFTAGLKLEEWRMASHEALMRVKITEDMPIEEGIRRVAAEMNRIYEPIADAYKNFHRLMVQALVWVPKVDFKPDPLKFFIGFHENAICFIPAFQLKDINSLYFAKFKVS